MSSSQVKDKLLAHLNSKQSDPADIRLDAKGTWHIHGKIINDRVEALILNRLLVERQGQYILVIDDCEMVITVEDTPLMVNEIRAKGTTNHEDFFITLSNGTTEQLDPETIYFRIASRALYCKTSCGMTARFDMVPMINFLERIEEDEQGFFMYIYGERKEIRRI